MLNVVFQFIYRFIDKSEIYIVLTAVRKYSRNISKVFDASKSIRNIMKIKSFPSLKLK